MTEMNAVDPNICEKVSGADGENRAFAIPRFVFWNRDFASIPAHFVTRGLAMIFARDFQGIAENARGVKMIVAGRVAFAPGRERFPRVGHEYLFAPNRPAWFEPAFFLADSIAV